MLARGAATDPLSGITGIAEGVCAEARLPLDRVFFVGGTGGEFDMSTVRGRFNGADGGSWT